MYTLKFVSYNEDAPLEDGLYAKNIQLVEAKDIWHRPYQFRDKNKCQAWFDHHISASGDSHFVSKHPIDAFNLPDGATQDSTFIVHFEYLTCYTPSGEFQKYIIFCAECYVMNSSGQTVDNIVA